MQAEAHGREALGPRPGRHVLDADRALWLDDETLAEDDTATSAAHALWGNRVNPYDYPLSPFGLTAYLRALGCEHLTGRELSRPRLRKLAERFYPGAPRDEQGRVVFLPGRWAWPRYGVLAWIFERLRAASGTRIFVPNTWRPTFYNAAVSEASRSDHLWACALDLSWPLGAHVARRKAIDAVIGPLWRARILGLSVGLYRRRLHVGVYSPRGRRCWTGKGIAWPYGG